LDRLQRLERAGGEKGPSLEEIVEAFVAPPLLMKRDAGEVGNVFMRLVGHAMIEHNERVRMLLVERFREVAQLFCKALSRTLPHVPPGEILWRVIFSVGSMVHAMQMSEYHPKLAEIGHDPTDVEAMIRHMVRFVSAGFQAPPVAAGTGAAR
jgi:hypothetical protein